MNKSVLAAIILAVSIQFGMQGGKRSVRQPFPESGFWVTETSPDQKGTIVRYYANSNHLVSTTTEPEKLDVTRLSVRKYLNKKLAKTLEKDSTANSRTKLYEIN